MVSEGKGLNLLFFVEETVNSQKWILKIAVL